MKTKLILGMLFLAVSLFATEPAKQVILKADHTHYQEQTQQVVASSNVILKYGDVEIQAEKLTFDTLSRSVWGSGDVTIIRGEDTFSSSYFFFDLDNNIVKIDNISVSVRPPDSQGDIYLHASRLQDGPSLKVGHNGIFTTCEYDDPHYYVWAKKFKYKPGKSITGYHVLLYNPFFLVPFPVPLITLHYTPRYYYDIRTRDLIWNFPSIGEKRDWGWFVQNTFDYNNIDGKDSSIFIDWYENVGIGQGIRHQYKTDKHQGEVYWYYLRERQFEDVFDENGNQIMTSENKPLRRRRTEEHKKKSLSHTYQISDPLQFKFNYSDIDAEPINANGKRRQVDQSAELNYALFDKQWQSKISEKKDNLSQVHTTNGGFNYSLNGENYVKFDYNESDRKTTSLLRKNANLVYYNPLPANFSLNQNFKYLFEDTTNDETHRNERLIYDFLIKKQLNKHFSADINVSHLFDLDQDAFSGDDGNNNNDHLYKTPEINLNGNYTYKGYSFTQKTTVGRYQEVKFDVQSNKQRIFPENHGSYLPNTYIFKQGVKKTFKPLKNHTLSTGADYDQYIFKTDGHGFLKGDEQFILGVNTGLNNHFFKAVKIDNKLTNRFAPARNNSPFYAFERNAFFQKRLDQSLTLYYKSESKYAFTTKTFINYAQQGTDGNDQKGDIQTELKINPNKMLRFTARTGLKRDFELPDTEANATQNKLRRSDKYLPIRLSLSLNPTSNIDIDWTADLNAKRALNRRAFSFDTSAESLPETIIRSNIKFTYTLFPKTLDSWKFSSTMTYKTNDNDNQFKVSRYQFQTIGLVKKEHRRTIEFSYQRNTSEFRFKMTIDAYPKDSIGFNKNRNQWKLEGLLDDGSEERF